MSEQIVHGHIKCLKCDETLELYAGTHEKMLEHFKRVAELLATHWANNCAMPDDPNDYF